MLIACALQDFVSSVSTLLTVRSYTENLRERIHTLDSSVSAVGSSFSSKKKALLESKKTAAHLDEAIDTLQACLRVLDLVNRVGDMIKEGRYWSALKVDRMTLHACFELTSSSRPVTGRYRITPPIIAFSITFLHPSFVIPSFTPSSN